MPAKIDDQEQGSAAMEPPVDEANPALGRRGAHLRQERAMSGNLPDAPDDGVNSGPLPFKITRG